MTDTENTQLMLTLRELFEAKVRILELQAQVDSFPKQSELAVEAAITRLSQQAVNCNGNSTCSLLRR